mgnify:CR=1 FL=1
MGSCYTEPQEVNTAFHRDLLIFLMCLENFAILCEKTLHGFALKHLYHNKIVLLQKNNPC